MTSYVLAVNAKVNDLQNVENSNHTSPLCPGKSQGNMYYVASVHMTRQVYHMDSEAYHGMEGWGGNKFIGHVNGQTQYLVSRTFSFLYSIFVFHFNSDIRISISI